MHGPRAIIVKAGTGRLHVLLQNHTLHRVHLDF